MYERYRMESKVVTTVGKCWARLQLVLCWTGSKWWLVQHKRRCWCRHKADLTHALCTLWKVNCLLVLILKVYSRIPDALELKWLCHQRQVRDQLCRLLLKLLAHRRLPKSKPSGLWRRSLARRDHERIACSVLLRLEVNLCQWSLRECWLIQRHRRVACLLYRPVAFPKGS